VAVRFKAYVCGRSIAEIVGSKPTGGIEFCLFCVCLVLSGRVLCDELITRPEEFYRVWCVVVCNRESSYIRRPWPTGGCCPKRSGTINSLKGHTKINPKMFTKKQCLTR